MVKKFDKTPEEVANAMPLPGKYPIVTFRVRRDFDRIPQELIKRYEQFFVPDVSDKAGRMYTMNHSIRPFYTPMKRFVGTALTVKVPPGDNMGVKQALQYVQPGDVLVVDAQGFTDWCLGGFHMLGLPIRERGLKALVVNGGYRDVSQAQEADFPIFAKSVSPYSGAKRGPCEINVPVCCGGVIVHPGDLIMGDMDGLVVVPQDYVEEIADVLDEGPGIESVEEMRSADLAAKEVRRRDHFDEVFAEKKGRYLD